MVRKLARIPKNRNRKESVKNLMTYTHVLTAEEITRAKIILKVMSSTQRRIIRNMRPVFIHSTKDISHNPKTKFTLRGFGVIDFMDDKCETMMLTRLGEHIQGILLEGKK